MALLIALDAGHGGTDSGAVGLGLKEKDWALDMVKRVGKYLGQYDGVSVTYTRETDTFVEIMQRCRIANARGANLFLSFHNNAGGGSGYESYVSETASATSRKVQEKVTADILAFLKPYGIGSHGDATKTDTQSHRGRIGVLRYTNMPAVLFENLFIDNPSENKLLKSEDFKEKLASAYAKSIAEFYGLKPKAVAKPTVASAPAPAPAPADMYDLAYLVGDELKGVRSSSHPEELQPEIARLMQARANCIVITKRGFKAEVKRI